MPRACKPAAPGGRSPRGRQGSSPASGSPQERTIESRGRRHREAHSCRTDHGRGGCRDRSTARRRRRVGGDDHEEHPERRDVRRSQRVGAAGRRERRPAGGRSVIARRRPACAGSDGQPGQFARVVRPSRPPRRRPQRRKPEAPAELRGPELLRAAVRQRGEPVLPRAARSGPLRRQRQGRRDRERRVSGLGHPRPRAHEPDRPQHAVRLCAGDRPLGPECGPDRSRGLRSELPLRQPDEDVLRRRQRARPRRDDGDLLGRLDTSTSALRRIRRARTPSTASTRPTTRRCARSTASIRGRASRTTRTSEPTATGSTSPRTCSTSSGRTSTA